MDKTMVLLDAGFLSKISKKNGKGRCQRLKIDEKFTYKQKAVDSLVVVDLMSIPLKHKEVKKVILVASDSDFVPVVKELEKLGTRVTLYGYYEKIRDALFSTSNELIKSVHKYVLLKKQDFIDAPLKKEVKK
ncbi:MAG: NYN domain-containing protein [archaeon]